LYVLVLLLPVICIHFWFVRFDPVAFLQSFLHHINLLLKDDADVFFVLTAKSLRGFIILRGALKKANAKTSARGSYWGLISNLQIKM
jgi:hypothetical protein